MKKNYKYLIFIIALLTSNLYLFQSGLWLYQDSSYWYKNSFESSMSVLNQFYTISNSYYLGFDLGLFNYIRILVDSLTHLLIVLFGSVLAQILFILIGYIISFFAFYYFSSIFIKNKDSRFYLSLLYTFNPLIFNLQGFKFLFAGIPLFIYSFYKFFNNSGHSNKAYLLLNIISIYIIISYIRFIQIAFFVILFYLSFLIYKKRKIFSFRKIILLFVSYFFALSPLIYSFFLQLRDQSQTAFYYGEIFKNSVKIVGFFNAFNFFQNSDLPIYRNFTFLLIGIFFSVLMIAMLLMNYKKRLSPFFILNLGLLLLGLTFYGLGDIFGSSGYLFLISYLPFIVNAPVWALYISVIPAIFLYSIIFEKSTLFKLGIFLFLIISILPLINLENPILKKLQKIEIPPNYYRFYDGYDGSFSEPTHYIPGMCWRSEFMEQADISTECFNNGYSFRPISLTNPRLLSGIDYYFSGKLDYNANLDNLRITHNLKNIVVANDIVKKKPGTNDLSIGDKELKKIEEVKKELDKNKNLSLEKNQNYNFYSYKNKDSYDFFIYSPLKIVDVNIDNFFKNNVPIKDRLAFSELKIKIGQAPHIFYKASNFDPTLFYFRARLTNDSPFVIQLNQTFNRNWKIIWITQKDFDNIRCLKSKNFSISNNSRCDYDNSFVNLGSLSFLGKKDVKEKNHYRSNILGNMWIINPSEIEKEKKGNEIYGVIVFEKQIAYSWITLVSILTLFLLFGWSGMEWLRKDMLR